MSRGDFGMSEWILAWIYRIALKELERVNMEVEMHGLSPEAEYRTCHRASVEVQVAPKH